LFLLYPAHGHVTPSLAVIAELTRRGRRVSAFVSDDFADAIDRVGATPLGFDPPISKPPSLAGMTAEEWGKHAHRIFLDVIRSTVSIEKTVAEERPGVVAFDSAMWAPGRVVTAKWDIPAIHLSPTCVVHEPFTPESMRIGEPDDEAERARLIEFGEGLAALFEDNGLPGTTPGHFPARAGEHTIVYVPREFQPEGDGFGTRYTFAGPCLRPSGSTPDWTPPAHDSPVLLLSLGTTSNDRLDLFRDCVDAFAESPWHVVITLGGRFDPSALGRLPSNVEAHGWIRHPDVLAHASAYVSQAGMGSIMEALAFGVPIVAVPSHPEAIANSRRLAELGLGRHIDADSVTGAAVRAAVEAVAGDGETADRLLWMRRSIERAGGARVAADVIDRTLLAHRPATDMEDSS